MTPTPDPSRCRGLAPGGPDCPTSSPGASPSAAPVKQPVDGDLGSGADGVLGGFLHALPWVVVAVLVVVVLVLLAGRARRVGELAPVSAAAVPPTLITELLTLADLATGPAIASQVRRVLRSIGIDPIEPAVGSPLDLDGLEVVATTPAPDAAHHERVARVHRPGWRRGDEVLRPAAVELWVLGPGRPAGSAGTPVTPPPPR